MPEVSIHATRTIGILGGMGPAATADFYQRIIAATDASCDQEHLHILIDSCSQIPDRTAFLLGKGEDPTPMLVAMVHRLENAGADLLVMACNTAHAFLKELAAAASVPIVNWIEEATTGVARALPSLQRVGLLATTGTVKSDLYQHSFHAQNVQVTVPDFLLQEQLMSIIYGNRGLKAGICDESCTVSINHLIQSFALKSDVQAILLACTELSLSGFKYASTAYLPIFDASQLVAERVVLLAGGHLVKSKESFVQNT